MRTAAACAAGLLALSLTVQPTLHLAGMPLRVSLADPAAAALAPLFLALLARYGAGLWRHVWPLLVLTGLAATLALTWALATGLAAPQAARAWALIKYAGWFLLLYYLALAVVLVQASPRRAVEAFLWTFLAALCLQVAVHIAALSVGLKLTAGGGARLSGLTGNANAFALMALCGCALVLSWTDALTRRLGRWGQELLTALLAAGMLLTHSVGALLALVVVGVLFAAIRGQGAALLRVALAAVVIYAAPYAIHAALVHISPELFGGSSISGLMQKLRNLVPGGAAYDIGLGVRIDSGLYALRLWLDHPVFGAGLGAFLGTSMDHVPGAAEPMQIHSTPLWLLTETGLLGFAAFAALFLALQRVIARAIPPPPDPQIKSGGSPGQAPDRSPGQASRGASPDAAAEPWRADMLLAGLLMLAGWLVMSLAHELMFQRAPWVILGLCLGVAWADQATERSPASRQAI